MPEGQPKDPTPIPVGLPITAPFEGDHYYIRYKNEGSYSLGLSRQLFVSERSALVDTLDILTSRRKAAHIRLNEKRKEVEELDEQIKAIYYRLSEIGVDQ
ncbi:MAG: hypothetical protein KDH96_08225 [Candidatus Riesia sp.]|nr:hypothetical protein [Candidatus Riesia sp.]